ncbi:hypothetical protein AAFN60_19045 [Roseibacillus persicicus]|uniref:hypothetical protein n=1 Tax=Roseibacillus persicicus TaxID=454148 RepID=UPI00398AC16E
MPKANAWREFVTFKELKEEVQRIVNQKEFEEIFPSELIADLIAERHYFCSQKGLRPVTFKKTDESSPYRFYGKFPDIGWHPVSWTKCATGQNLNFRKELNDAMRLEIAPKKISYRKRNPICECCQTAPSEEVHHADPPWKTLVKNLFQQLAEEEFADEIEHWDWFAEEPFRLNRDKALYHLLEEAHEAAKLESLCGPCHRAVSKS